jgi:hypothetical protein
MADESEEITLLRRNDAKIDRVADMMREASVRLGRVELGMVRLHQDMPRAAETRLDLQSQIDRLRERVDRINRRLDLTDA